MSSSSSDSDSDEEMRARLLDAVICPKSFKSTESKIKKAQDAKIKVGPYEDIELSRMEYKRVGEILAKYTDDFFEFREPKSKTNKRLEAQENIFRFCPNHRIGMACSKSVFYKKKTLKVTLINPDPEIPKSQFGSLVFFCSQPNSGPSGIHVQLFK